MVNSWASELEQLITELKQSDQRPAGCFWTRCWNTTVSHVEQMYKEQMRLTSSEDSFFFWWDWRKTWTLCLCQHHIYLKKKKKKRQRDFENMCHRLCLASWLKTNPNLGIKPNAWMDLQDDTHLSIWRKHPWPYCALCLTNAQKSLEESSTFTAKLHIL